MSAKELKAGCRKQKKSTSGTKTVLVQRIMDVEFGEIDWHNYIKSQSEKKRLSDAGYLRNFFSQKSDTELSRIMAEMSVSSTSLTAGGSKQQRAWAISSLVFAITNAMPTSDAAEDRLAPYRLTPTLLQPGNRLCVMGRMFQRLQADPIWNQLTPHVCRNLNDEFIYHVLRNNSDAELHACTLKSILHWNNYHHFCYHRNNCPQLGVFPLSTTVAQNRAHVHDLYSIIQEAVAHTTSLTPTLERIRV
jgi:hypothetical protein